jgi:hypothetical protein
MTLRMTLVPLRMTLPAASMKKNVAKRHFVIAAALAAKSFPQGVI